MKRHYARLARIGGRAMVFSLLAAALTTAYAQPPDDIVAESYSQLYQVAVPEAERRLALAREAGRLGQQLEREQPETFAGLYIEHRPEFRVVVQFTGDAQAELGAYTRDPTFVARSAPRSLELLLAVQAEVAEQLQKAGLEFESGLDIKNSEINVYVLDPASTSRHLARLLSVAGFVKVHKTTGFPQTTALTGGHQLTGAVISCTSGFNVVETATRELGLSTAGHCDDALTYQSPSVALVFQAEQDAGSYDMQWHKQPTAGTPEQQLNDITVAGGQVLITSATASAALALGDVACKSGITTGHTCGEIADKNAMSLYNGVIGTYIRVSDPLGGVMNDFGDSGGPVFGTNSAYGLVHGRGASGTPTHNDLYFMPVDHFSVLGIEVLTEPFEIDSIPDVSGSPPSIPVDVNFSGYPRFPVDLTVEMVSCPVGWTCTGGTLQFTPPQPPPLSFVWGCQGNASSLPVTFTVRTSLKDASGIAPPPVDHNITCTATAAAAEKIAPGTPRRAGLLRAK
ncbi:S1 family peptidase [Flavobacterium sp. MXW15]|uniref:S1 family peptidase n=1 Tax=Xanthomonas chitinilytica TaxID=2989819 RepID=A0ABT3JRH0_9XANT|nr:S1 family peptidase [Xanthomonas sp. H13-6]MCW4453877.1 S1 family peptidase [Flavobacterium sp. MXW15]MCW4471075.1 S1 family peptidase [Xanthomonas sp. H13-6]